MPNILFEQWLLPHLRTVCTSSLPLIVTYLHFTDITLQWLIQHSKSRRSWEKPEKNKQTASQLFLLPCSSHATSCSLWRTVFHPAHTHLTAPSPRLSPNSVSPWSSSLKCFVCAPRILWNMPLKSRHQENVSHVLVQIVHFRKPVGSPKLKPKVAPTVYPFVLQCTERLWPSPPWPSGRLDEPLAQVLWILRGWGCVQTRGWWSGLGCLLSCCV